MRIEIPDNLLTAAHFSEKDLKTELALIFYQHNVFTLGQASAFAGIHQIEVQKLLKKRNIHLHYDLDDLNDDMQFVNES